MQDLIDKGKGYLQQGLYNIADKSQRAINNSDMSGTNKDIIGGIKNKLIGGASDFVDRLGKKDSGLGGRGFWGGQKSTGSSHELSGWDRFKNGLASFWNSTGGKLFGKEAHIISPKDYTDKHGDAEKNGFSWTQANKNDQHLNEGKGRGDWDVGKIVSAAVKVGSMV